MSLIRTAKLCAFLAIFVMGCRATPALTLFKPAAVTHGQTASAASTQTNAVAPSTPQTAIRQQPVVAEVSFQQSVTPISTGTSANCPAISGAELSLPQFIVEVQARNPSLQAMMLAWQAAAERYPQVVALDDPMFDATLAPASFDSNKVESAYALEVAQKFPWFGKRAARGRSAKAEAHAAYEDAEDTRIRLAETAQLAFLDYYLVSRQEDLIRWNTEVMRQFRDTAQTKYRANQVTQQDILQADVELAQLDRRRLELQRLHTLAVARINILLHQPPIAALPPPPAQLSLTPLQTPTDPAQLQQIAIQRRPDLAALAAQVSALQEAQALAYKQYYPDTEVYGRYDTFWQPASTQSDLRGQVGVRLNVPIYWSRLNAAVREASYRVGQKQAEYDQKLLDVQYEVQQAYAELYESQQTLNLYTERLVPIADQNVAAARSNYDVGKTSFLDLAVAQRQLIDVREKYQEALAAYHRRAAEMERIIGGSLPSAQTVEEVPIPLPQ